MLAWESPSATSVSEPEWVLHFTNLLHLLKGHKYTHAHIDIIAISKSRQDTVNLSGSNQSGAKNQDMCLRRDLVNQVNSVSHSSQDAGGRPHTPVLTWTGKPKRTLLLQIWSFKEQHPLCKFLRKNKLTSNLHHKTNIRTFSKAQTKAIKEYTLKGCNAKWYSRTYNPNSHCLGILKHVRL